MSERRVLRLALRASLTPLVALWGLDLAAMIGGGAILVETAFDLHGVGQYAAESVSALDLAPIMAVTMYGAFIVVTLNAVADIAGAYLDPRTRGDYS